jgi:hypothetical protein
MENLYQRNEALAMGAPYSAIFSEILQSIEFIDILHLVIKHNIVDIFHM